MLLWLSVVAPVRRRLENFHGKRFRHLNKEMLERGRNFQM